MNPEKNESQGRGAYMASNICDIVASAVVTFLIAERSFTISARIDWRAFANE